MAKRSRHVGVFKLKGQWWECRQYKRNGEWRYCYAPSHSCDPFFSKTPLTKDQLGEMFDRRMAAYDAKIARFREEQQGD